MKGQLNPDWVEWLMGWPIGWSSLEPLTDLIWLSWEVDPADLEVPEPIPTPTKAMLGGYSKDENCRRGREGRKGNQSGNEMLRRVRDKYGSGTGPIPRIATNIPDRVSRLKCLGNGQVPACVAMAWQMLSE